MSSDASIAERKKLLRARMRSARQALSPSERADASERIAGHIQSMPELASAAVIAGFAALPEEPDLQRLLESWATAGRSVILPRVVTGTKKLTWHKIYAFDRDLNTGYGGIREPRIDIAEFNFAECTAALIPSIAVAKNGFRLGFGAGFYDTNLPALTDAILISPAFECQLVDDLPVQSHDRRMDAIVTENGVIRCR